MTHLKADMSSMSQGTSASRSIFVIGAAGGVGRRLTARLAARGHHVTGMHRAGGQDRVIRDAGGAPVPGDLIGDSVQMLSERLAGHDAIVFSAGAHGTGADMTTAIDGHGLEKAADAAARAGVRRFVLVSVFMDALRDQPRSDGFEHYMAVKRAADIHLAATDLDFLIVRPGTLVDDPGTARVNAGVSIPYGAVPRDDVAAFIAASLFHNSLNRTDIELTTGDLSISDAIAGLTPRPWRPDATTAFQAGEGVASSLVGMEEERTQR
jgi:nucleoside-diphosphate-sugar epimerase